MPISISCELTLSQLFKQTNHQFIQQKKRAVCMQGAHISCSDTLLYTLVVFNGMNCGSWVSNLAGLVISQDIQGRYIYKDSSTQHNFYNHQASVLSLYSLQASFTSLHQHTPRWSFFSQPSWSLYLWHSQRKRGQLKPLQTVQQFVPWYLTRHVGKMHKGNSSCSRVPVTWKRQITATTVDIKRCLRQNAGYDGCIILLGTICYGARG